MIYADNAATTKLDIEAFEAMKPWLLDEFGNASQPYSFARNPKKALAESREIIASCIGAKPEEVFFTAGGTESDNWVIKGSAFGDPDHQATITSSFEHHAVLHSCEAIERLGYPVAYIAPGNNGIVTPEALEGCITPNTRLVSIMYANNEIGSIQPIKDLCTVAHRNGALFHTDAVQAVGHVSLSVDDLGVDYLSASGHKFNGPKGIGFLYCRTGSGLLPFMDGGSQEKRHRAGTENIAGIVGMAVALKRNFDNLEETRDRIHALEKRLLRSLADTGVLFTRNGGENTLPGLISLSFPGCSGEAILHRLDLAGICISTGSACDSVNMEISHVLKAIRLNEEYARGTVRISLGKHNTADDVEKIVAALVRATGKPKR